MKELLNFTPFANTLIEEGIIDSFNSEETIIEIGDKHDFLRLQEEGKIRFHKNPPRVTYTEGKSEFNGFLYIRDYYIEKYNRFPAAHISNCINIKENPGRYIFSSKKTVYVYDKNSNKKYPNLDLSICKNCIKDLNIITPETTTLLIESLVKEGHEVEQEVGADGYNKKWAIISRIYRRDMNYICEDCGIDLSNQRRFSEVHHIDRNKKNNSVSNLKCLCILCHASVDETHIQNFKERKKEILLFIQKNYEYLKEKNKKIDLWH